MRCEESGTSIECEGSTCEYGAKCPRRFIARVRKYGPLHELMTVIVRPVEGKELGLFLLVDVEAGQPIVGYRGLLLEMRVAEARRVEIVRSGGNNYLLEADGNGIEASVIGSSGRFVNHACGAAATAHVVYWHCGDERHTVICASRKLLRGTEVTYSYGYDISEAQLEEFDTWIKCTCGARQCSKIMGCSVSVVRNARERLLQSAERRK